MKLLPFDHVVIHIRAIEILEPKRNGCELCDSGDARVLRNGARLCKHCREALREMQEVGE